MHKTYYYWVFFQLMSHSTAMITFEIIFKYCKEYLLYIVLYLQNSIICEKILEKVHQRIRYWFYMHYHLSLTLKFFILMNESRDKKEDKSAKHKDVTAKKCCASYFPFVPPHPLSTILSSYDIRTVLVGHHGFQAPGLAKLVRGTSRRLEVSRKVTSGFDSLILFWHPQLTQLDVLFSVNSYWSCFAIVIVLSGSQ
jgi:hypothetical protein